MYVKWFDTVMFYYVIFLKCLNFPPVTFPYVPTSQGTEPRRQMPALAGGDSQGC
ncbi:unnamed protein product [Staurois parvus]|uniref:Uncharacterized protein n=1 Tax=Staurois parvus TaxID=386267 RepID=A0ABN9BSN7_9NEOB|nr:unnamed protein product [Staurois parvus]